MQTKTIYRYNTPYYNGDVTIKLGHYINGDRRSITLMGTDGIVVAVATVNLPDVGLSKTESIIKDYAGNVGMLKFLQDNGIAGPVKRMVKTGHVECPVVDIYEALIKDPA